MSEQTSPQSEPAETAADSEPAGEAPKADASEQEASAEGSGGGKPSSTLMLLGLISLAVTVLLLSQYWSRQPQGNVPLTTTFVEPEQWDKPFHPLLRKAKRAAENDDREAAEGFLKQAHKSAPNAAETNAELGSFYVRVREFEKAAPFLQRARELDPKQATIAGVYARCLAELGETKAAEEQIAEATRLDPSDTNLLLLAGIIGINARRYDNAIAYFRLLLRTRPRDKQALRLVAHAYQLAGRHTEAAEALAKLIEIVPADNEAHEAYLRQRVLSGQGQALRDEYLQRYTESDKAPFLARFYAKTLALDPARQREAIALLERALDTEPRNADLIVDLVALHILQREHEPARRLLERALEQPRPIPKVIRLRALLARLDRDWETAAAYFDKLEGRFAQERELGRLALMRDQKQFDKALARIKELRARAGAKAEGGLALLAGQTLLESGKPKEAALELRKALRSVERPDVYSGLAQALILAGQPGEAATFLGESLESEPKLKDDERARLWYAVALLFQGQPDKARLQLQVVADTPRVDLPHGVYRAIARYALGLADEKELDLAARFHPRGRYFENDAAFFKGLRHELKGDKAAARAVYREALSLSQGFETPARVAEARAASLGS